MYSHSTNIRVRYSETDQMGFVYYGVYATYFEVARVEALRNIGIAYKELETQGILMPVVSYQIDFMQPAHYDELLKINAAITQLSGVRIRFEYETFNENDIMINRANTVLAFLGKSNLKPVKVPENLLTACKPFFN